MPYHLGPLLEVRRGLVVFERRLIAVDFIKGEERRVGLVLDDVEAVAIGLAQDGASAVGNRGLDEVVDVVLLDFEPNHEDVHSTSLQVRLETRRDIVTLNTGLHVRSSIPGLRHGYESSAAHG